MTGTATSILKVGVEEAELDDWTLPPEVIISGNPVAKGRFLWQSSDKRLGNGVWSCEVGSFTWEYTWDETICFLEGEATITDSQGNSETYGTGDLFFVPIGTKTTWDVTKPVRKVFHLRSDDPVGL